MRWLFSLLSLAAVAVGASCAHGVTGFLDGDAGAVSDAGFADAPAVVFPPDDPTASIGDDAGASSEDAALIILPTPSGEDAAPVVTGPPFDAGPDGACSGLGAGDLAIDELLVESLSGTGDHGEWLEVESTRDCALDLLGLHGECSVGAKVITLDVTTDLWIPPRGRFVIADSVAPAVNHALPGVVLGWSGSPGDVLRNEGGTVTLTRGNELVDTVTYPTVVKKLAVGTSMAFPSDCPPGYRSNWAFWQPSQGSWFPGFHGTPNAPNDDVQCPDD